MPTSHIVSSWEPAITTLLSNLVRSPTFTLWLFAEQVNISIQIATLANLADLLITASACKLRAATLATI